MRRAVSRDQDQTGVYTLLMALVVFAASLLLVFLFYTQEADNKNKQVQSIADHAVQVGTKVAQDIAIYYADTYVKNVLALQKNNQDKIGPIIIEDGKIVKEFGNLAPCYGWNPQLESGRNSPYYFLDNFEIAQIFGTSLSEASFRPSDVMDQDKLIDLEVRCALYNHIQHPRYYSFDHAYRSCESQSDEMETESCKILYSTYFIPLPYTNPGFCHGLSPSQCVQQYIEQAVKTEVKNKITIAHNTGNLNNLQFWQDIENSAEISEITYNGNKWSDFDCNPAINNSKNNNLAQIPTINIKIKLAGSYTPLLKPPTENVRDKLITALSIGSVNLCPTPTSSNSKTYLKY